MTDEEVIAKFESMASKYMNARQMKRVIDTVFSLEKLDDTAALNKLMICRDR